MSESLSEDERQTFLRLVTSAVDKSRDLCFVEAPKWAVDSGPKFDVLVETGERLFEKHLDVSATRVETTEQKVMVLPDSNLLK